MNAHWLTFYRIGIHWSNAHRFTWAVSLVLLAISVSAGGPLACLVHCSLVSELPAIHQRMHSHAVSPMTHPLPVHSYHTQGTGHLASVHAEATLMTFEALPRVVLAVSLCHGTTDVHSALTVAVILPQLLMPLWGISMYRLRQESLSINSHAPPPPLLPPHSSMGVPVTSS